MAKHEMQKLQYIQKLQYLEGEIVCLKPRSLSDQASTFLGPSILQQLS